MRRLQIASCVVTAFVFLGLVPMSVGRAAPVTATISAVASDTAILVGETVYVDLFVNTGGQAVGGVTIVADFSSNLAFSSLNVVDSIFDTEVFGASVTNNRLQFERVRNQLGYTGTSGFIARATFTATSAGLASVSLVVPGSVVVAFADSTNILNSVVSASFVVESAEAVPTSTPTPTPAPSSVVVGTDTVVVAAEAAVANPGSSADALAEVIEGAKKESLPQATKEETHEAPEQSAEATNLPPESSPGEGVARDGSTDLDGASRVMSAQQKAEVILLPLLLGVLLAMNLFIFYRAKR